MKNIRALSISTILTSILIVIFTVYSELNEKFKDSLKSLFGHHWVSKGVISLIFFFLAYFLLNKYVKDKKNIKEQTTWVIIVAILGTLVIFLFYVYEFFV